MFDLRKLPSFVPGLSAPLADGRGSALVAADARRLELDHELVAVLYRYRDTDFLVPSVTGVEGGIRTEIGEPTVLPATVDDAELGWAVRRHLLAHVHADPTVGRDDERSDRPVCRASGARSVTGFEAHGTRIRVETVHLAVRAEAAPCKSLHPAMAVCGTARHDPEAVGTMIRRIPMGADALRAGGIVRSPRCAHRPGSERRGRRAPPVLVRSPPPPVRPSPRPRPRPWPRPPPGA